MVSRARIAYLWRDHRLLFIAFLLSAALALFFAGRTTAFYIYWSSHRNAPLEGWMTVGYVARSYGVDRSALRDALGLPAATPDRRTLAQIADERGVPLDQLLAQILEAIEKARAATSP